MLSHCNEPFFLVKHALKDGMNVRVNGEFDFYARYLLISWLNIIRHQIISLVVTICSRCYELNFISSIF